MDFSNFYSIYLLNLRMMKLFKWEWLLLMLLFVDISIAYIPQSKTYCLFIYIIIVIIILNNNNNNINNNNNFCCVTNSWFVWIVLRSSYLYNWSLIFCCFVCSIAALSDMPVMGLTERRALLLFAAIRVLRENRHRIRQRYLPWI